MVAPAINPLVGAGGSVTRVASPTASAVPVQRTTIAVTALDPGLSATGIPKIYYDNEKAASNWYWQNNPPNISTVKMVLAPADNRSAAEQAAGSTATVLAGSRSIWEEVPGSGDAVATRVFMRNLYVYCQNRLKELLNYQTQAVNSPDGGWQWYLNVLELTDAALRATNVSPALLREMIIRRTPDFDDGSGGSFDWTSAMARVPSELRDNPIYALSAAWSKTSVPPGGLGIGFITRPYWSMMMLTSGNIPQVIQYARRPENRTRDNTLSPQATYGQYSIDPGMYDQQPNAALFMHGKGVWYQSPTASLPSGVVGPAGYIANARAMADLVVSTMYEAWTAEALTLYSTMILMGGQGVFRTIPAGRPFVSMDDLNALWAQSKQANLQIVIAVVSTVASITVAVASANLKGIINSGIALGTQLAASEKAADIVSLVLPLESPFRRTLPDGGYSTSPTLGDTPTVTTRIFTGMTALAQGLAAAMPAGLKGQVGTTVWNPAVVDFLNGEPVQKSNTPLVLGVVGLGAALVVGILYVRKHR